MRSTAWNVALVAAILLLIGHNVIGYRMAARPLGDAPIVAALTAQLRALRNFSRLTIVVRGIALLIFLGYFTSTASEPLTERLWVIVSILAFVAMALYSQYRIWQARLQSLSGTLAELTNG